MNITIQVMPSGSVNLIEGNEVQHTWTHRSQSQNIQAAFNRLEEDYPEQEYDFEEVDL